MGDVYQEKEKCIDFKEALKYATEYFRNVLVTEDITITDIQLGYSSTCTVKEDGTLQDLATPYWYVRYCTQEDGSCCLVMNALTGEGKG